MEEAKHVFIRACGLAELFASREGPVCVAELGFGTGLNFLLAWDCWRKHGRGRSRLHYHAWEAYPLDKDEWQAAHAAFPETAPLAGKLATMLPPRWPGWHNVEVEPDVTLTLAYEDVSRTVDAGLAADAWFLDGFSPARNPEMWAEDVLEAVGDMTVPGGTVATYSAAGHVRARLAAAGLEVSVAKGFGKKRSMTLATKTGKRGETVAQLGATAVVGAGIAGASVARELGRRQIPVQVFDPCGAVALGASANPAAMLSTRLTGRVTSQSALSVQAFSNSLRAEGSAGLCEVRGSLSLRRGGREDARQDAIAANPPPEDLAHVVDASEASSLAGANLDVGGLFVPRAMQVDGASLVARLIGDTEVVEEKVVSVARDGDGAWALECDSGESHRFDTVVLAASHGCDALLDGRFGFGRRDGSAHAVAASPKSSKLRVALQYGGCLTPPDAAGVHMLTGIGIVPGWMRDWLDLDSARQVWSASRCITKDRHPVVGSLGDGLHVLAGLGSRGFTHAPLLAGHLVARMLGEQPLLSRPLERAVSPGKDRKSF